MRHRDGVIRQLEQALQHIQMLDRIVEGRSNATPEDAVNILARVRKTVEQAQRLVQLEPVPGVTEI